MIPPYIQNNDIACQYVIGRSDVIRNAGTMSKCPDTSLISSSGLEEWGDRLNRVTDMSEMFKWSGIGARNTEFYDYWDLSDVVD